MTQEQRNKVLAQGKRILRAKYDSKGWRICEQTQKGGWSVYDNTPYSSRDVCEKAIDEFIKLLPGKFVKD
jgi:hypothetical protein